MAKATEETTTNIVLTLTLDEANVVYALAGHAKRCKEAYSVCAALEDVMEYPAELQITPNMVEFEDDSVELDLEGWSNT